MRIKFVPCLLSIVLIAASVCAAQTTAPSPTSAASPNPAPASAEMSADVAAYGQMLSQLQQLAQQTNADLGKLRIDKWKTDSANKQQSQSKSASLQRNLTTALPELIQRAQAAPQDLDPSFKLYRNLDVLYDVLSTTAENAGAFGPKEQYEPLANDTAQLDQIRHSFADRLDWLAGTRDRQIAQLRQQLAAAQQAKSVQEKPAATPAKKSVKKRKKPTTE